MILNQSFGNGYQLTKPIHCIKNVLTSKAVTKYGYLRLLLNDYWTLDKLASLDEVHQFCWISSTKSFNWICNYYCFKFCYLWIMLWRDIVGALGMSLWWWVVSWKGLGTSALKQWTQYLNFTKFQDDKHFIQ